MLSKIRASREEEGFTLIELLVVVIIIGILAAIAIPVFLNQREKAYRKAVASDLRNSAIQLESYFADYNVYPGSQNWGPGPLVYGIGNDTITVSTSVSLVYTNEGNRSYCIVGSHAALDPADTQSYDSDGGGVVAACN